MSEKNHDPIASSKYAESLARDLGIERATLGKESLLQLARECAIEIGQEIGVAHSDLVNDAMQKKHGIGTIGNAAGAIFRTPNWQFTGHYHLSTKTGSHRRPIRVWKYVGSPK